MHKLNEVEQTYESHQPKLRSIVDFHDLAVSRMAKGVKYGKSVFLLFLEN